jgi:heterodisulfide reductase subunit C
VGCHCQQKQKKKTVLVDCWSCGACGGECEMAQQLLDGDYLHWKKLGMMKRGVRQVDEKLWTTILSSNIRLLLLLM